MTEPCNQPQALEHRLGPIVFNPSDANHLILEEALRLFECNLVEHQVFVEETVPVWYKADVIEAFKDVVHPDSQDPLAIAADSIIGYLSPIVGDRPQGYFMTEHSYIDRVGFLKGEGILAIDRLHFYNWVPPFPPDQASPHTPVGNIPDLVSLDPDLHNPLSIDLMVFEHPIYPGRFVFQAFHHERIRPDKRVEWADYSHLYDAGVYLSDNKRVVALKQLGLMPRPPYRIELK